MRKSEAHFLGFEIKTNVNKKLKYVSNTHKLSDKKVLKRVAGAEMKAWPDKQRLISRLHMKGYCNKNGKPKELGWLSSMENFSIISRYNAVLRGLVNYYAGFIGFNGALARWLYIIKYSCLKTLCCKYKTKISKLYNKMGVKWGNSKTVKVEIKNTFQEGGKEKTYEKSWQLLTYVD